jgi:Zn-dependent peptidase ImmA (M78 family)
VELSEALASELSDLEKDDPKTRYRSKLVSVRQFQSKGMSDEAIERALGVTLFPRDRLSLALGSSNHLSFQLRWDAPARPGNEAANVKGMLQIVINGARVPTPGDAGWRLDPAPLLGRLAHGWSGLMLQFIPEGYADAEGISFARVLRPVQQERRMTLRMRREGLCMVLAVDRKEWRTDFAEALQALEALGNLLAERLLDTRKREEVFSWERRKLTGLRALSVAAGKPKFNVVRYLASYLKRAGQSIDFDSLTFNSPEAVVAARMAPHSWTAEDVIALLDAINEIPSGEVSVRLQEDSTEATAELSKHSDKRQFEQGYAVAEWARQKMGFQNDTVVGDPDTVLSERWHINFLSKELPVPVDAIAVWGPSHGPSLIVNRRGLHARSAGGRRATLAHEICHLLIDRSTALPVVEILGGRIPNWVEMRARAFAAEFLVPRSAIRRIVADAPGIETALDEVVHNYRASAALAAWHTLNSGAYLTEPEKKWLRSVAGGPGGIYSMR